MQFPTGKCVKSVVDESKMLQCTVSNTCGNKGKQYAVRNPVVIQGNNVQRVILVVTLGNNVQFVIPMATLGNNVQCVIPVVIQGNNVQYVIPMVILESIYIILR